MLGNWSTTMKRHHFTEEFCAFALIAYSVRWLNVVFSMLSSTRQRDYVVKMHFLIRQYGFFADIAKVAVVLKNTLIICLANNCPLFTGFTPHMYLTIPYAIRFPILSFLGKDSITINQIISVIISRFRERRSWNRIGVFASFYSLMFGSIISTHPCQFSFTMSPMMIQRFFISAYLAPACIAAFFSSVSRKFFKLFLSMANRTKLSFVWIGIEVSWFADAPMSLQRTGVFKAILAGRSNTTIRLIVFIEGTKRLFNTTSYTDFGFRWSRRSLKIFQTFLSTPLIPTSFTPRLVCVSCTPTWGRFVELIKRFLDMTKSTFFGRKQRELRKMIYCGHSYGPPNQAYSLGVVGATNIYNSAVFPLIIPQTSLISHATAPSTELEVL